MPEGMVKGPDSVLPKNSRLEIVKIGRSEVSLSGNYSRASILICDLLV